MLGISCLTEYSNETRVLKNGFIMAKIGIIGNGSIASSIVAKLQDTEQKIVVVKDEVNSILEQGTTIYINNTYHHLDSRSPSKTQLRKCEKGLHEFQETQFTTTENSIVKKQWFCKHCGTSMHNRG